jgi:hypothetical protein
MVQMNTEIVKLSEIMSGNVKSPIPIEIIPNYMGINLCSVDAIGWQRTDKDELVNLTIYFIPSK